MMAIIARRPFLISLSSRSFICSADLPLPKFSGSCVSSDARRGEGGESSYPSIVGVRRGQGEVRHPSIHPSIAGHYIHTHTYTYRSLTKPRSQGLSEVYVLSSVASSMAAMTAAVRWVVCGFGISSMAAMTAAAIRWCVGLGGGGSDAIPEGWRQGGGGGGSIHASFNQSDACMRANDDTASQPARHT